VLGDSEGLEVVAGVWCCLVVSLDRLSCSVPFAIHSACLALSSARLIPFRQALGPLQRPSETEFYDFDNLIPSQGDVTLIIEMVPNTQDTFYISAYTDFNSALASAQDISHSYLTACDISVTKSNFTSSTYMSLDTANSPTVHLPALSTYLSDFHSAHFAQSSPPFRLLLFPINSPNTPLEQVSTFAAKRKYKPVALKVRPVLADLPDKFRITRNIIGDPLTDMPQLLPMPPPFQPTGRYTEEN
jgi:hypothetical protein